jgi:hypothetical protein
MNLNASFVRKVIYLGLIALLLIPLFWLGMPSVQQGSGASAAGGRLAQLRATHELSQANLGEIDPVSEAMRLGTLGLQGPAACILWVKAMDYKKREDWDNLSATLNQMIKLQPNYLSVWEFQSHNISYNVSVEFDDYRARYHWVKKGIDFLMTGTYYNRDEPRLMQHIGWFLGQKIGRSDESAQFRRLFRKDTDLHDVLGRHVDMQQAISTTTGEPDNWLAAWLWYEKAEALVDAGRPLRGKTPLIFHSEPSMCRIDYATALEEDFLPDEIAQYAWQEAGKRLHDYGVRPLKTSYDYSISLLGLEDARSTAESLSQQLDALVPGGREAVLEEKRRDLSPQERLALDTPQDELTRDQYALVSAAREKTQVHYSEIADKAPADVRPRARRMAADAGLAEHRASIIERYRQVVNFDYWQVRCEAESTSEAITARRNIYEANALSDQGRLVGYWTLELGSGGQMPSLWYSMAWHSPRWHNGALDRFEAAWNDWDRIMTRFPALQDSMTGEDLIASIGQYRSILEKIDQPFPEDFKLQYLVDLYEAKRSRPPPGADPRNRTDAPGASGTPGTGATESGSDKTSPDATDTVPPSDTDTDTPKSVTPSSPGTKDDTSPVDEGQ